MEALNLVSELKSSPALIEKLSQFSIKKEFKAGSVIFNESSYSRSIPIVIKGAIRIFRTEDDGREILLYYLKSGESCIISLSDALHNDASKVKAEVEEDAEILFLPADKAIQFIKEYPQWLEYIFKSYHERFEDLLEIINAIAFKKVDQRLLALLHKKAELTQSKTISITHEQLANELGTARVVVSRLLKQLEEEGEVELGRNKIVLLGNI